MKDDKLIQRLYYSVLAEKISTVEKLAFGNLKAKTRTPITHLVEQSYYLGKRINHSREV